MMTRFSITPENPRSIDAAGLLGELSASLAEITGSSGAASFDVADVSVPRSIFVVALNPERIAVGCDALRPISRDIAEIKRMYSNERGAGSAILEYLETKAFEMDYRQMWLETRRVNGYAVNFYLRNGFQKIPNYGKYIGSADAICFAKTLIR